MSAILDRLDRLSNKPGTHEHQAEYQIQVDAERNDRGAVLLIAANLENSLELAISRHLANDRWEKLLGTDKPLGSFRNKILVGYALNIYGDATFNNLEIIRKIRNAFAHAKIPISFDTEEINDACNLLNIDSLIDRHYATTIPDPPTPLHGRPRFKHVCNWLSNQLFRIFILGAIEIEPAQRGHVKDQLPSGYGRIVALPEPLP